MTPTWQHTLSAIARWLRPAGVFLTCLLLGLALLGYAATVKPYTDEARFEQRYGELDTGQSAEFYALREEMLTPKYACQDYGITLLLAAGGVLLCTRKGRWRLNAPPSRWWLVGLALALPLINARFALFDLNQAAERGEFPHWADTLAMPAIGIMIVFLVTVFWVLVHLIFLFASYPGRTPLREAISHEGNWWLLLLSALVLLYVLYTAALGQYWTAAPCALWVYFYLSLATAGLPNLTRTPNSESAT